MRNQSVPLFFIIIIIICSFLSGCFGRAEKQKTSFKGVPSEYKTIARSESNMIIVDNGLISIAFSKSNGSIGLLKDLKRGITFINNPCKVPFRVEIRGSLESSFKTFSYNRDKNYSFGQAYTLIWEIEEGIKLYGKLEVMDNSDEIRFTSYLENISDSVVFAVEYPVIGNIDTIADNDCLAHPYVTGLLIKNPGRNFIVDGDGLRFMPYPESFSGASMQFFTYYAQGKGGFYCAAYDGEYRQKWLNFYKMNKKLELSLMYGYEDIGPRKGLEAGFPFILKMINGDGWYEAADLYKQWAIKQEWCGKKQLFKQDEASKSAWLHEDIGLATFGINGMHDRTRWIKAYHDAVNTPVFHILGPDWPKTVQNFYSGVPGGYDDWFPTRFSRENLDLIRKQGDKFAPFEFDFLVDVFKSDGENLRKSLQMYPVQPRSHDRYNFSMLCPYTQYTKDFHIERDVQVYREAQVDSMYYDISANNLIKTCMSPEHGHPIGAGQQITKSYREIYEKTRREMSAVAGKYIPLGTEMICETFIDVIDYYQARAWAQPSSALETWPFRELVKSGYAEMIPMFTYVYHEYGPVRIDGWGKLVKEIGELYYHNIAKVYLWGGIYELNYEYSPMEAIDGTINSPEEHYFIFEEKDYSFDEERAHYLAQFAALRTGKSNPYLAYGIMQRPLEFQTPKTKMQWFHYNHVQEERGSIEVPAVLSSAWKLDDDTKQSLAFLFANTDNVAVNIKPRLDIGKYGLKGMYNTRLITGFKNNQPSIAFDQGEVKAGEARDFSLHLEPRTVYLLEVYK